MYIPSSETESVPVHNVIHVIRPDANGRYTNYSVKSGEYISESEVINVYISE